MQDHKQHIFDFLKNEKSGVLSTVRANGFPDAAFMYYMVEPDNTICFITRDASRKMLNIEHQNNIVFTVPKLSTKEVVEVRGIAAVLPEDEARVANRLLKLAELIQDDQNVETVLPLLKHTTGTVIVVRIQPTELRWRRYSNLGLEEEKVSV